MAENPLISVIVPIFKVEQYLDRCVESIVNQTYSNLEIILVDDGSPDNCPAMCDAWAEKDWRIKVIHKENGGLSDARNSGMAIATGELMGFIDSDDWIHPEMYQRLYDNMQQNDSDIAACGVEMVWEDNTPSRMLTKSGSRVMNTEEALTSILEESWLKQPVWYKLYKTKLVRDIPFPIGKYHEDVFWSYQAIGNAKTVSVFDELCYYYLQRAGSIMGQSYSLKRLDALEAKLLLVRYMEENHPELAAAAKINLWGSCIYAGQMLLRYCDRDTADTGFARIDAVLHTYPIQPSRNEIRDTKQFVWLKATEISLAATCKVRNFLKIGF